MKLGKKTKKSEKPAKVKKEKKQKTEKKEKKKLTKKQLIIRISVIVLAVILVITSAGLIIVYDLVGGMGRVEIDYTDKDPDDGEFDDKVVEIDEDGNIVNTDSTNSGKWGTGRVKVYNDPDIPLKKYAQKDPNVTNILIFGVDARSAKESRCRADALMVMSIDSKNNVIKLTSIMRDTQMKIPGISFKDKVTHAYAYGGVTLLINTINLNLDLDIQNFVMFDFHSAEYVIDKIGGVEIDITKGDLTNINKNIKYANGLMNGTKPSALVKKTGVQTLNGRQAVAYARIRYNGGDQGRTRRQRAVVDSLLNRFLSASLTTKYNAIETLLGSFETSMSKTQIITLGTKTLTNMGSVEQYRIPEDNYASVTYKPSWQWLVNWNKQLPALHKFIYGENANPTVPSFNLEYKPGSSDSNNNTSGGSTSGGNTSGGNTSGGSTSGGSTSGGSTSGGSTSGGNTSGGSTSGGSTSGGNTSGGSTSGGNTSGGGTTGGDSSNDNNTGDSTGGDNGDEGSGESNSGEPSTDNSTDTGNTESEGTQSSDDLN